MLILLDQCFDSPLITRLLQEWLAEDHMRMEEEGNILISRQCAKHVASGKTAVQYLVGRRISH